MGPGNFWYGGGWVFPMVMPIFMLLVFLILLYLVFGRGGFRPPWRDDSDRGYPLGRDLESPMEILRKRYAKGEITREEFEQIKKDIANP